MSELRILLVEDDENRVKWFKSKAIGIPMDITLNPKEAKELLRKNEYTQIFLDHDLAYEHYAAYHAQRAVDDETTGYAVAKFLADNPKLSADAEIIIHSLNEAGADRMWRKIKETRRRCQKIAFIRLTQI